MGGISVRPVECAAYETAEALDKDFEDYVNNGLLVEAGEMLGYSWISIGFGVWAANTSLYLMAMDSMIECGISNNLEGSKYGNADF